MKRVATCIIALLLAYNGALAADEAVFVKKVSARSVREIGSKWTCKEGSLVCGGTGNFLVAGKAVGAGDFQVRARLSLERPPIADFADCAEEVKVVGNATLRS